MRSTRFLRVIASFCVFAIVAGTNDTELERNKTGLSGNGKTYFIQMKKMIGNGEEGDKYVKINHYKEEQSSDFYKDGLLRKYEEMFGRLENAPENLKEISDDVEEASATFQDTNTDFTAIEEDWSYNVNHSIYDLPNITHEIYEAMLENNKHNTIKNASTVKFFFEIDTNMTSNIIRFNIDSLEHLGEKIVDAELHVYRLPRETNATKPNSSENVVRLYQMTDSGESSEEINRTEVKSNPDLHKLANVIYISSNYAGWQVFKVKNVLDNWKNGEDNLGFLISTMDSWENEDSVDFAHRERNGGKYQPSLVVYLDRGHSRSHDDGEPTNKAKWPYKPTKTFGDLMSKVFNPCARHVWYVSFHELGWNNFIIAPNGYMAYKCKGSCRSPIATSYTNHGKLLNVFERTGNSIAPCCVPNNYRSLLIMYYDKESNVVIKEYDDMIVGGCGCR